MNSKRIQKYLIDRDDTMFYHTPEFRIYVDTHCNDLGGIYFVIAAFSEGKDELGDYGQRIETRIVEDVTELERTMKDTSGDMRKWHVLKNGS